MEMIWVYGYVVIGVFVFIALKNLQSAKDAFNKARDDYINGLHSLPKGITQAVDKDTALTEENVRLKEDLESSFKQLHEARDSLSTLLDENTQLRIQLSNTETELKGARIYLERIPKLEALNANLEEVNLGLAASLKTLEETVADNLAINVDTFDLVDNEAATESAKEAVDELLGVFGDTSSVYETGIYNGVVAVANTLFESNHKMRQIPVAQVVPVEVTKEVVKKAPAKRAVPQTLPLRSADGRFLPRTKSA